MSARTLENSQRKKMQLSISHREKCYLPQASGTGACVRQDAGLGGQMHHALRAELCKMAVGRQTLNSYVSKPLERSTVLEKDMFSPSGYS